MGSLKVILNTKVYKGMSVEQPNEKSVRLTGMDETGAVKVFLVMCSPKDAGALCKALKSRLAELNRNAAAAAASAQAVKESPKEENESSSANEETSKRAKT